MAKNWRWLKVCSISSLLVLTSCGQWRLPEPWVIPNGYTGWVKMDYIVKNAPPLKIRGGYWVVDVSNGGCSQTS